MGKRVHTGCRDCKRCTNSGMAEAGRKLGKLTANLMTMGATSAVLAFTKDCRGCGHALSLHNQTGQGVPTQNVDPHQGQPAGPPASHPPVFPAPGWYPVPGGTAYWDGRQWIQP